MESVSRWEARSRSARLLVREVEFRLGVKEGWRESKRLREKCRKQKAECAARWSWTLEYFNRIEIFPCLTTNPPAMFPRGRALVEYSIIFCHLCFFSSSSSAHYSTTKSPAQLQVRIKRRLKAYPRGGSEICKHALRQELSSTARETQ